MGEISQPAVRAYTWEEMAGLCRRTAAHMRQRHLEPTAIVGILRGGCFPALMLSHLLGVARMHMITVRTTVNDAVRARRHAPEVRLCGLPSLRDEIVLLIDDVTNTGSTLRAAKKAIGSRGSRGVFTAALVWDTVDEHGGAVTESVVNYYADKIDAWAKFPWEG